MYYIENPKQATDQEPFLKNELSMTFSRKDVKILGQKTACAGFLQRKG